MTVAAPERDRESEAWLRALRASGAERDRALAELHALLLRLARAEALRRRASLADAVLADLDDICLQAANDALVAIGAKLERFEGRSRFTTWACKFVLLELSSRLRRHAWRGRPVKLDQAAWERLADARAATVQGRLEQHELLRALRIAVESELTPLQREVFQAAVLGEVPIDVLAERLGSTRGAVYKTLHDARRKLRAALARDGYEVGG
jgi:RNA polymerase sigma-70 factor, ECF subfamily